MKQSPLSPMYRLRVFSACLMSLLLLLAPMAPLAASVNRIAAAHAEKKAARDLANNAKKKLTTQEALERSLFVNPPPPVAPNISATLTDSFVDTNPADGRADPGSTVTYTAVISNSGSDATGVSFSDTLDGNTTLVPGSLKVSPLAFNDVYSTANNTQLVIATAAGVLVNDKGTPAPTVSGITNPACADLVAPFVCTTTQGGTVTLNTDGSFTYNPLNGFAGADSFSYTASNTQLPNDTGVVTITVGPPNLPPSAKDDAAAATEAGGVNNGTAGTNPAGNLVTGVGAGSVADTDPEAGALTVVAVHFGPEGGPGAAGTVGAPFAGTYGSLTLNSNGSYTYTVDNTNTSVQALRTSGQTLQDVFNYTIQDPGGLQDIASFTITIAGANDNPVAVADTPAATEAGGTANGTPGTDPGGNVLTNDTDVDTVANGETKTVQGVAVGNQAGPLTTNVGVGLSGAGPANYGTLTIAADGTFTYVVNNANATVQALKPGDTQTDTFSYTMKDAANATSTTTVTITINGADDDPVAVADSATVNEDSGANAVDVLTNDTDVDTGPKSIGSVTQPANGAVVITGGGTGLTYQPNPNYCNSIPATLDTFTYTLNGGSSATVSMTVTCVNDPPVNSVPGAQSVNDNATLTFNVANTNLISVSDIDVGAGNLQVTVSVPATKGTLVPTVSGAGIVGSGTNSVVITGTPTQVNGALNGMVYTPPTGLTQDIVLTVLTSDLGNSGTGGAQSDSDTVTITVNALPAAVDDPYSTPQNTPLTVPAATGVLNNDTLNTATITSYGTPTGAEQTTIGAATPTSAGGSVTLNADGSFSYTVPGALFSGPDTFKYTLTNVRGSSTATVTITVSAPNTAPTANNDTAAATEAGGANNGTAGTNPAGNLVLGTGSAGAVADTDTQDPSSALVVVSVRLGNVEGAGTAGTLGTPLAGSYGSLTLNSNGSYTYTVDNTNALVQALRTSGQTLQDSFNYTIQDTGALTDSAVFTVTIAGANDNPTAVTDVATAVEASGAANGTAGTNPGGNVLTNDTDPDTVANGETKTVQGVAVGNQAGPLSSNVGVGLSGAGALNYGTLTIAADGTFTYVVNQTNAAVEALNVGGTLTDTFSYTMKDAANATSTTTITITIQGADDNPVAVADSATVLEDAAATAVVVLTNDTDVDGGPKSISSVTQPTNGAVVITGGGTGLTYAPNGNYCNHSPGATFDTFNYTLNGGSSATVSMTVTCVNDPPVNTVPGPQFVADTGTLTFSSGNSNQISVADVDAAPGNVQVTVSVPATKGTLSGVGFSGNGSVSITITNTLTNVNTALNGIIYTPPAGSSQAVVLTVLTSDLGNTGTGGTQTDSDTVTINIDQAPSVTTTVPANGANPVGTQDNISITFSEPVNVTGTWFTISCATSGAHTAAVTGGPTTFTLNPDTDFVANEVCTVTIDKNQVTDQDSNDPPDNMAANKVFSFTTDVPPSVTTTIPAANATDIAQNATITVNFSESVAATTSSFTIVCTSGGSQAFTLSASPSSSFLLTPTANLPAGDNCTVTVIANQISDTDTADPPDNMVANFPFTFKVKPDAVNDLYPQTVIGNVNVDSANIPYSDTTNDVSANAFTISAFDAATANGGQVVMQTSGANMGKFTYNPPPGFEGTDTFNYTISRTDGGGTDTATISVPVSGMVWFINNGAASCTLVSAGCGRLTNPFSALASFNTANGAADVPLSHIFNPAANDNIFVYESATGYTGAVTLLSGQKLIGQDATATLSTITGLNPPSGSAAFPLMNTGGNTSNITSTVTLNTNTTVRGLSINSTTTTGMNDPGGAITGVSVSEVNVATTTGTAVLLSSVTGTLSFGSVSANGGSKGISVTSLTGSFTSTGGTIQSTSARGAEFITTSNGASNSVILSGMTFTNATTADGADPTNQAGGCGSMHGGGSNQSCNAPIFFDGVSRASLSSITVTGSTQMGININASNDVAMTSVNVSGAGNNANEFGMNIHNLLGTNNWSAINIHDNPGANHQVYVEANSTASTGTFNITGASQFTCALSGGITRVGGNLLSFDGYGSTANMDVSVTGATFSGSSATAMLFHTQQTSGTSNLTVTTSSFTNNNSQIDVAKINGATVNYTITNNATMTGANFGEAINVFSGSPSSGTMSGTISGNTIGNAGVAASGCTGGCGGIFVTADNNGSITANITNNAIHQVSSNAINAISGDATGGASNTINLNITGNTIDTPVVNTVNAIFIEAGTSSTGSAGHICAKIGDVTGAVAADKNIINGNWGGGQFDPFDSPILLRNRFGIDVFRLAGWSPVSGSVSTSHDVSAQNFVIAHNTITANSGPNGSGHQVSVTVGTAALTGGAPNSCPLLLLEGGVMAALNAPSLLSNFDSLDLGTSNETRRSLVAAPSLVTTSVNQQQLDSIVHAALERWASAGLTLDQIAALRGIKFEINDLSGAYLGEADGNRILVDRDAQGKGWFIGSNSLSDSLFSHAASATRRYTDRWSAPAGHIDLLTAIEHEMGHKLGLGDSYAEKDRDSLMYGYLTAGERRLPAPGQAKSATISNNQRAQHLTLRSAGSGKSRRAAAPARPSGKPVTPLGGETVTANIGTLPAGKSVTITFQAVLNTAMPSGTSQVVTQGTVTYNSGPPPIVNADFANPGLGTDATLLTDDPATPAVGDATITPIDAPTASASEVAGRILDSNGNPVEGAAVRMTGTQNRLTVTDAAGNYHFDDVETNGFYTVVPSRANFSFSPSQRAFSQLGQHTDAIFSASPNGGAMNPLDTTEYFVRQQYVDFLNREPDESGLGFWVNNIESCGNDANCRAVKRTDTSAAFFLSVEFQQTGYLVYRTYQAAFGDLPGASVPIRLGEFKPDAAEIGNGVIVNQSGWDTVLDNNKQAFAAEFVQRARFASAYPTSMTPSDFVDKLFTNAGVRAADSDRAAAISEFGAATTSADVRARGRALRRVAENATLAQQEFTQAFVLMEYFGYLRRDANTGPDTDFTGYNFWLDKLNAFGGNYQNADMVKAFLVSGEYRGRFPR